MPSLGNTFTQARLNRGISLRDASFQTRLPEQAILDLEQDRYLEFDSLVYLRWFIQRYSEYLGLECSDCLERMQSVIDQAKPATQYLSTGHRTLPDTRKPVRKHAPGGGMPVFLAPVLLALLAFVGFSLYALAQQHLPEKLTAAPASSSKIPASHPTAAPSPLEHFTAPGIPTASTSRRLHRFHLEQRIHHQPAVPEELSGPSDGSSEASDLPTP